MWPSWPLADGWACQPVRPRAMVAVARVGAPRRAASTVAALVVRPAPPVFRSCGACVGPSLTLRVLLVFLAVPGAAVAAPPPPCLVCFSSLYRSCLLLQILFLFFVSLVSTESAVGAGNRRRVGPRRWPLPPRHRQGGERVPRNGGAGGVAGASQARPRRGVYVPRGGGHRGGGARHQGTLGDGWVGGMCLRRRGEIGGGGRGGWGGFAGRGRMGGRTSARGQGNDVRGVCGGGRLTSSRWHWRRVGGVLAPPGRPISTATDARSMCWVCCCLSACVCGLSSPPRPLLRR